MRATQSRNKQTARTRHTSQATKKKQAPAHRESALAAEPHRDGLDRSKRRAAGPAAPVHPHHPAPKPELLAEVKLALRDLDPRYEARVEPLSHEQTPEAERLQVSFGREGLPVRFAYTLELRSRAQTLVLRQHDHRELTAVKVDAYIDSTAAVLAALAEPLAEVERYLSARDSRPAAPAPAASSSPVLTYEEQQQRRRQAELLGHEISALTDQLRPFQGLRPYAIDPMRFGSVTEIGENDPRYQRYLSKKAAETARYDQLSGALRRKQLELADLKAWNDGTG